MPELPTLLLCHGDDGGPRVHPCRRVQEALRAAGIEYDKVIAVHGSPDPVPAQGLTRRTAGGHRPKKCRRSRLPDGTATTHSRAILAWIDDQS